MVITFSFYQFLIGRLWAEIVTAIVWRKLVKSWRAPIFCRRQYLWCFLHGEPVQCVRDSAHKSRAAIGNNTLGDCTWRAQHLQREVGEYQRGLGKVSCCGLCRAKTVRRCFCACANILLMPRFCQCQYFVNTNTFSPPIFCLCLDLRMIEHFINDCVLWISWLLLICLKLLVFILCILALEFREC